MKIEEMRAKTDAELDYDLTRLKKELFGLRFRATIDSASNTAMIMQLRRSIARANTVLHERKKGIREQEPKA